MNRTNLLIQADKLKIDYLDFDGYNEIEKYDKNIFNDIFASNLFDALYIEYVKPILNTFEVLGIDWVEFHSIQRIKNDELYAVFYDGCQNEYNLHLKISGMKTERYHFIKEVQRLAPFNI